MRTRISALLLTLFCITALESKEGSPEEVRQMFASGQLELPWLTGPLLAPSATVVPRGHFAIEPYVFSNVIYGRYGSHWHEQDTPNFYNINTEFPMWVGLSKGSNFAITPQFSYNHTDGASEWVYNDMPFGLDVQFLTEEFPYWWPSIKLQMRVTAPTGKFQHLNPNKKGTDIGGSGSWNPTASLCFSRFHYFGGVHFIRSRLFLSYTVPNSVHVSGLNTYGGGKGTHGKVIPGNIFTGIIAFEYTVTQNFALALDFQYSHLNKTRFRGNPGFVETTTADAGIISPGEVIPLVPPGTSSVSSTSKIPAVVGFPSSDQFSLAPALEYNFSSAIGIIGGAWFSIGGRNASAFASGVIAVNIYI